MSYTVAVIGTGTDPDDPDQDGYAMAYHHVAGYKKHKECTLVACADIIRENAEAFADEFDLNNENVFVEYEKMLGAIELDQSKKRGFDGYVTLFHIAGVNFCMN